MHPVYLFVDAGGWRFYDGQVRVGEGGSELEARLGILSTLVHRQPWEQPF
jgi:hypothetical protein